MTISRPEPERKEDLCQALVKARRRYIPLNNTTSREMEASAVGFAARTYPVAARFATPFHPGFFTVAEMETGLPDPGRSTEPDVSHELRLIQFAGVHYQVVVSSRQEN